MDNSTNLNAICPYFTMFPLGFPLTILRMRARPSDTVLDPFCGRGTTNFAARLLGMISLGVDSSPVASAITAAKLANATADEIVREANCILQEKVRHFVPRGEFWSWAYNGKVLVSLSKLRTSLLCHCATSSRIALRGIILGALHGPLQKQSPGYFSNQCMRSFSPKPGYAVRYWKKHKLKPPYVDVLRVIKARAERYYDAPIPSVPGRIIEADSRDFATFSSIRRDTFSWIITSPPYYGMRTYLPDQWLRNWFVGGTDIVDYSNTNQLDHSSPDEFSLQLRMVWRNAETVCKGGARMVIRFGGIRDRNIDPLELIKDSLRESSWVIDTIKPAGKSDEGKRQADGFLNHRTKPLMEYDVWARIG